MLREFIEAVGRIGLTIHSDKTNILSNVQDNQRGKAAWVSDAGEEIRILSQEESTTYLGCEISFGGSTRDTELRNRISKGWAKFMSLKRQLCCKRYPLHARIKLFNATVTPSVLYACGAWSMTTSRKQELRVAQRKMLRRIVRIN